MNFITITTKNYLKYTIRLIRSLKLHHPDCKITVFGDEASIQKFIEFNGGTFVHLSAIKDLGVKRAKFRAYTMAAHEGDFIYLDSDIIVLNPLTDLIHAKGFTACRDDLNACHHFISDTSHPWTSAPNLSSKNYFNSGAFFAESNFHQIFEQIEEESRNDEEWEKFTIPNRLYDNHFLCAKLAQRDIQVNFISETKYNWQGYHQNGGIVCFVNQEGKLTNNITNQPLNLVHFAGISDIDDHIASIPGEVAHIFANNTPNTETGLLEVIGSALNTKTAVEPRLQAIIAQSLYKSEPLTQNRPGKEIPILGLHSSVASISQSVKEADFLWNDLKCGSAYLSASEYQALRLFIRNSHIEGILEFGAGYTTVLFQRLGLKQIALEGWNGPWLDFALQNGADARLTPFCPKTGFLESTVKSCLDEISLINGKKLIFIDSPPGTENRLAIVDQMIKLNGASDFYAVHDSIRDAAVVYKLSAAFGMKIIDHIPSLRGLTILGNIDHFPTPSIPSGQVELRHRMERMLFEVKATEQKQEPGTDDTDSLLIEIKNTGQDIITAASDGIMFSIHLADVMGTIYQWDTPRYELPVDLEPGDRVSFKIDTFHKISKKNTVILFDLVKENHFWWSNISSSACPSWSPGKSK